MASKASMSVNLGLPAVPDADTPELYGALTLVYNAVRNLGYALDQYTGNVIIDAEDFSKINPVGQFLLQKTALVYVKLTEAVTAGQLINLYDSGGLRARKAQDSSKPCRGYATMAGAIGETIPVCLFGLCQLIGGLTPGVMYYTSAATAGALTNTATTQKVGYALGTNLLFFHPAL